MRTVDFLVIGAGILGLSIARELKRRLPDAAITVLEKEAEAGRHSSGRNSGVLHSGLYYPPGSLKARLCRQGAAEMAAFHEEHGLPLKRCGKILTPAAPRFADEMAIIAERAAQNGVKAKILDERALRELEPETRSATGSALWVPDTAVGAPLAAIRALARDVRAQGVELLFNSELADISPQRRQAIPRNGDAIHFAYAINAAGLHADRVAHRFGAARRYALLPFKGLYWKLNPDAGIRLNHLVYPVPDLRILYLGVHTTTAVDGAIYLGPTAAPAWGRENYLGLRGIAPAELPRIARHLARMFISDQDGFRAQAWQEGRRYFKRWFFPAAQSLLPRLEPRHLLPAAKVGLHPRIFDREKGELLKDFLLEHSENAIHLLGATSPAWTSAFPLARHLCDQIPFFDRGEPA
ncbi:MAG: L-2-hydroxyglutarate oxidase [Azoarcus sp.]|jgi:L-2-hydroxyglutarate oxidase LhgO|nr:L-2-hydroxyglutarate oxidase [Azoarcus sp.]